jgi:SulP family sulfate permease
MRRRCLRPASARSPTERSRGTRIDSGVFVEAFKAMLSNGVNGVKGSSLLWSGADPLIRQRLSRWEIAGAFGDIGVLFPIAVALISLCHMNPTAVFLAAGLAYFCAGLYFEIPIAVQPFKAVATIALALQLTPSSIASAGFLMGLLLIVVGIADFATPLAKLFSLAIVRGIQLGLGLILIREGFHLAFAAKSGLLLSHSISVPAWAVATGAAAILVLLLPSQRFPAALVLLAAGTLFGLSAQWAKLHALSWTPVPLRLLNLKLGELAGVLTVLVVPQFALTFGNSIVSTENTARLLYGKQAKRVTARALCVSVGLINLCGSLFIAAPCCHGSGGITAHHKFGARTASASYVIGSVCLVLAVFGESSLLVLALIPTAVLGVFLIYVGAQHAALVRDIVEVPDRLAVAASVGLVGFATTNLTYGFLAGFAMEGALYAVAKTRRIVATVKG